MRDKLLLHLLRSGATRRSPAEEGMAGLAFGVITAIVLALSGAALVTLTSDNTVGVFASSSSKQARGAAEAGIDEIISTWNQPRNRKMLVSGLPMNQWASATGNRLRSPCVDLDDNGNEVRPGGNGQPSTLARSFGDGQFRDVATGAVGTGERRFRLTSVTFSAPDDSGAPNPRELTRTTSLGAGVSGDSAPSGKTWDQLLNLQDPDGPGTLVSGANRGFITLTVEGQVVRGGEVIATSTVTQEFEVLPKCCGASLGSQGSGGTNLEGSGQSSLGSDSRYCGLQMGIVSGLSRGWHWSYYANDRFTMRNPDGSISSLPNILGAVPNSGDAFDRDECRTIPSPNGSCNGIQDSADRSYARNIARARPTANCIQPAGSSRYFPGPETDILGESASCIPIIPVGVSSIPAVSTYLHSWAGSSTPSDESDDFPPQAIIKDVRDGADAWSTYPRLETNNSNDLIRIRTNSDTTPPSVQICDKKTTISADNCTGSDWETISVDTSAPPSPSTGPGFYGDFASSSGSEAWDGAWVKIGTIQNLSSPTGFRMRGGSTRPQLIRGADLSAFTNPVLTLRVRGSRVGASNEELLIRVSRNGGSSYQQIGKLRGGTSSGRVPTSYREFTFPIDQSYAVSDFRIRLQTESGVNSTNERYDISDIKIESGATAASDAWCEYTAFSPITVEPGFHCLGPTIDMNGGRIIIDTTGGPLSFYYSDPSDDRTTTNLNSPYSNPDDVLIFLQNQADISHVRCSSVEDDCTTPVPDSLFSPIGEPTQLNFFGRDWTGSGRPTELQAMKIATRYGSTSKIGGVWFYFPMGQLELRVESGSAAIQPPDFYSNDDNWSFSGRVWTHRFKPFGPFHMRVPPSLTGNKINIQVDTSGTLGFVTWTGEDWVARATSRSGLFR
ncbi:hypothetical protein EVJ50_14185 [Synechococcus sp. RSCCF101]|uniref:hypothetical protein n=1 Tax=Synechococcus sp. RSCCF101 TaxID=2511069 RepID=UPI00124577FD|nr:hypothetical protein [Synechococcus sp. RSCCF101]QEY33213.1 hypothetical protein EVJ50_14185 [Synechococcus sp. RSCCF101]